MFIYMKKLVTLPLILLFTVQLFYAQTADQIITRYFEGVGGMDKWKSLTSIKMSGNLVMSQGEFPITLYRKTPNKFKIVINVMGQEIIPQAFDGETGWMNNPLSGGAGPQQIDAEQVKALKDESEFEDPFIDYRAKGFEASYEGTGDAGGVQCHIIKLIKNKGVEGEEMSSYYYFDTEHYLQIMIKQPGAQAKGQDIEIYLSDYQETEDGLLMPFVLDTQYQGKSVQKLSFTAIAVNEEMPDELFSFPGEKKEGAN
jgi:hypothetical protein